MFSKKLHRANNPVSKILTFVVLTTFLSATSCTTTRVIKSQPDTIQSELKKGDIVAITTKDGENFKFEIAKISLAITDGFIEGRKFQRGQHQKSDWQQILFSELVTIEKTELHTGKTVGLVSWIVVGILLVIFMPEYQAY